MSPRLQALGPAQGFPILPDFEYVVRRNAKPSLAADRLRDVIIDYFRLTAALRRTNDDAPKRRSADASGLLWVITGHFVEYDHLTLRLAAGSDDFK